MDDFEEYTHHPLLQQQDKLVAFLNSAHDNCKGQKFNEVKI